MTTYPATRYGCPTCDTQGPLLPHDVELTGLHRAAHQAVWATTAIPTQRAVNELHGALARISALPSAVGRAVSPHATRSTTAPRRRP